MFKMGRNRSRRSSLDELYKEMQKCQAEQEQSEQGEAAPSGRPKKRVKKKISVEEQPAPKKSASPKPEAKKPAPKKSASPKPEAKKPAAKKPAAKKPSPKAPEKQTPPVSRSQQKATNKAVNKAVNKSRTKKRKKQGSRGGNYVLYYLFAGIIAIIVFTILAKTVLFDLGTITVEGNTRYTADEIIANSGLTIGTSLLDIDTEKTEEVIIGSLSYIDAAEVKKSYPTKVEIVVKEAERWYVLKAGNDSYIISRLGKIIEEGSDPSLPVVLGYDPLIPEVGRMLSSEEDGKNDLPSLILSAAESAELVGITSIDITDRFEIKVIVEDRVTLDLGLSDSLENKLHIARELIETEISATERVTVNITNPEKAYVRDNNIIENDVTAPQLPAEQTAESSETAE